MLRALYSFNQKNLLPPERDSYDSGDEGRAGVLDPSSSDSRGGYGAEDDVLTHEPSRYLAVCNLDWKAVRAVDILYIGKTKEDFLFSSLFI